MTSNIILAPKTKAVLKQQTFCHSLKFPNTVLVAGEQIFLGICHGGKQLFFILADQREQFLVSFT